MYLQKSISCTASTRGANDPRNKQKLHYNSVIEGIIAVFECAKLAVMMLKLTFTAFAKPLVIVFSSRFIHQDSIG